MIGQVIDVALEKNVISLAKITQVEGEKLKVKYMSPTSKKWGERRIYKYEEQEYEIEKENICGYYDTEKEDVVGYEKIDTNGFVLCESDSEYEPSDSEEEESESESESEYED
jgi:hypothetical protein